MSSTTGASGTAVEFDPFSDTYFNDPYEMYRQLRNEAPVYHNEHYGFYALSRYDDVCRAAKDWGSFSSTHGVDLSMLVSPFEERDLLIMMDPPKHDRMRALVSRVFTPRAVTALEPMVREVIDTYLEPLAGEQDFDILEELFAPFPVEIISRMLGVPEGDRQKIRHWLDIGLYREPGQLHPTEEGMTAMFESGLYFYELIQAKRAEPGDDMLSRLIAAEVELDDGTTSRLTDEEIAGFAALLGGAGAETVTKLLGNAVVLFHRNPDEYRKVVDDRAKVPAAVEEILRILPPAQYQGRFSVKDVDFDGEILPAGHPVLLVTGSATRDERAFDDPDRFDIDRPPSLSLGFGYGVHSCLGAALARMEARIAIEELIDRWPNFGIDEAGLRRVNMSNVAGYGNVPFRVN